MIVNGATKHGDMAHFNEQLKAFKGDVCFEYFHEQQLLALQGPTAAATLQKLLPQVDLKKVNFMTGFDTTIGSLKARVTRCGYTGEDGFEISVSWKDAPALADMLLKDPDVHLSGIHALFCSGVYHGLDELTIIPTRHGTVTLFSFVILILQAWVRVILFDWKLVSVCMEMI